MGGGEREGGCFLVRLQTREIKNTSDKFGQCSKWEHGLRLRARREARRGTAKGVRGRKESRERKERKRKKKKEKGKRDEQRKRSKGLRSDFLAT